MGEEGEEEEERNGHKGEGKAELSSCKCGSSHLNYRGMQRDGLGRERFDAESEQY